MPRFTGRIATSFTTPASLERVKALLSNPATWQRLQVEIERSVVVSDTTLDITLKEHTHGPAKFQGVYRCTWAATADGTTWDSDDGANFAVHGRTRLKAQPGGGTVVSWEESVEADVPVPRLMVRVVRPIAERLMARGLKGYVKVIESELER